MISSAAKACSVTFAVFVAHRALSFSVLLGPGEPSLASQAAAFVVGALSDLWVAYLAGVLAIVLAIVPLLAGRAHLAVHTWIVVAGVVGLAICGHQSYVDFFHFQLIPFHLGYILDPDFVAANGASVVNGRSIALFVVLFVASLLVAGRTMGDDKPLSRQLGLMTMATLLALAAHNRNIHLRVQWFVPDHLQMNAFERFYFNVQNRKTPERLSPDELRTLETMLAVDTVAPEATSPDDPAALMRLITKPAQSPTDLPPIARRVHEAFSRRMDAGAKPLALVVLLESLRPSETGYFSPDKPSLTPNLDALSRRSVTFTRALSTGSVTRGAQEALFCGYLGSRDTSLMRGNAAYAIECLPDLVRAGRAGGKHGETFWFHGGEGRFDGQLEFWRARGVGQLLSLDDFPMAAPRTGWGVSDRSFFATAAERIAQVRKESAKDFTLGMLLSVTNHIPWDLPPDANVSGMVQGSLAHPSYHTSAYTDAALGELITSLRASDAWRDALIIVASDHGNNVPPYADLYGDSPLKSTWLQSHINLILTGGLIDEALTAEGVTSLTVDHLTSQTDVAAFLSYVIGLDARVMGENLFATHRSLPVLSDLEEGVFDPVAERLFRRDDVVAAPPEDASERERKSLLYYRAFLQLINTWSTHH